MSETMSAAPPNWLARNFNWIAGLSTAVAAIGVLAELSAGFGYRLNVIPLQTALLQVLPIGAYIAAGGVVLCLITLVLAYVVYKGAFLRPSTAVIVVMIAAGVAAYLPYSMKNAAAGVPPIHDITTDTEDPPAFIEVLPLRDQTHARNTASYDREHSGQRTINVPEAQHKAYPDIKTLVFDGVPPAEAYKRALAAVKQSGWTIVADRPEEGRIEAWDRTFWFGFIDDVVIRVAATDTGSKIDIRSLSRVGGSDVGKNAQRIRGYVKTLMSIKG
ncbi:MAG: DUF1499 domain-containing protein [Rhodospirillaceae bacterium]